MNNADQAPTVQPSQTYWARIWRKLRKNKAGMSGLWIVVFLLLVGAFTPMLANDKPIVCSYKGEMHFPAMTTYVDIWVPWQSMRPLDTTLWIFRLGSFAVDLFI